MSLYVATEATCITMWSACYTCQLHHTVLTNAVQKYSYTSACITYITVQGGYNHLFGSGCLYLSTNGAGKQRRSPVQVQT